MYSNQIAEQTILRLVDGGATSRHRLIPVEKDHSRSRHAAVTRLVDWMPIFLMGAAGAATGIIRIAETLTH